jgi:hypothetical protein
MKRKEVLPPLPFEEAVVKAINNVASEIEDKRITTDTHDLVVCLDEITKTLGQVRDEVERLSRPLDSLELLEKQMKRIADAMEESNLLKKIKLKR